MYLAFDLHIQPNLPIFNHHENVRVNPQTPNIPIVLLSAAILTLCTVHAACHTD